MTTRTSTILVVLLLTCVATSEARKDYILHDFRYYKPMVADIRTPTNMMRLYYADPVEFTIPRDSDIDRHLYWDVSYGGVFPMFGYNFTYDPEDGPPENPMEIAGIQFFFDASAHMLLDFDAESAAVINTDFRIGFGFSTRLWGLARHLSFRYRFFHESTHIGDEYSLFGSREYGADFRRYNVSWEAHDFFVSWDKYVPVGEPLMPYSIAYARGYGGHRLFSDGFGLNEGAKFAPDELTFEELNARTMPIRASKFESQLGGEVYLRIWPEQNGPLVLRRLMFHYLFFAAELYYRDLYRIDEAEKHLSSNMMVGICYGNYFGGERDFRLIFNWYRGVHPHGQFRQTELSYIGLGMASDF